MFDLNVRFVKNYVINGFPFASFVVTSNNNQYIASVDYNYFSNECQPIETIDGDTAKKIFNFTTYMDEYLALGDEIVAAVREKLKERIG